MDRPAGQGMGLAIWRTEESYNDIQYIVKEINEDVYTALTNPKEYECKDETCTGKLVNTIILKY